MAVAARETQAAQTASRADLERVLVGLETHLRVEAERVRSARAAGEDVTLLERRWQKLLGAYERIATYLSRPA